MDFDTGPSYPFRIAFSVDPLCLAIGIALLLIYAIGVPTVRKLAKTQKYWRTEDSFGFGFLWLFSPLSVPVILVIWFVVGVGRWVVKREEF